MFINFLPPHPYAPGKRLLSQFLDSSPPGGATTDAASAVRAGVSACASQIGVSVSSSQAGSSSEAGIASQEASQESSPGSCPTSPLLDV